MDGAVLRDGCIDGRLDEQVSPWINRLMEKSVDGWIVGSKDKQLDR